MKLLLPTCLFALATILPALLCGTAEATSQQQIRVVLDDSSTSARIKGELQWSTASEALHSSQNPGEVSTSGGRLQLKLDGKSFTSARLIARPQQGYVQYAGQGFRGHLELFVGQNGRIVVLNVLPLEEYLYGVVPAEMSPSWPVEALKCQAVAARTYALSRILANMERTYDVYGNVSDQAYRGVGGEHAASTRAVDETAGLIAEYGGQVITAYYCACAGGMTKQGDAPYLRSVASDHPDSPHHGWQLSMTLEELSALVSSSGAEIGPIKDVTAEYDAHSGHLLSLIVHGANDSKQLYGTTLRKLLGRSRMKSTRCRIYPAGGEPTPVIASAPPEQAPATDTDASNVATEVHVDSISFQGEDGGFRTSESFGWLRPWVASGSEQRTIKMRSMYAFDGSSLMQCNREMHLLSGWMDTADTIRLPDSPEAGAPPVAAEPLPEVQVVNSRMARTELSSGFMIRGDGYGHGIGMSQWGARKLAEDGMDFQAILRHFYYGIDIVSWDNAPLMPGEQPETDEMWGDSEFYEAFTPVELD